MKPTPSALPTVIDPTATRGLILHVDDDELMRSALLSRLIFLGYRVISTAQALEAPELLERFPIVILTGMRCNGNMLRSFELRADALIEKPCDAKLLDLQLQALIARVRTARRNGQLSPEKRAA